jgi:hypothetical protein
MIERQIDKPMPMPLDFVVKKVLKTRALATSAGWTTRSMAAVMVPLTLLPLLKSHGALVTCAAIASAMIAGSALLGIAPRGRAARPVI